MEGKVKNIIEVGARLKKRDAPEYVLEVTELMTPKGDLPHARARVRISTYDLGVRLYSVSALADQRHFLPAADPVNHHETQ